MSKNVKVLGQGVEKHQLVEIDVLDVPSKIRKMYGLAKDKKQDNFFRLLGFKKEFRTPMGNFYCKFFDTSDNTRLKKERIYAFDKNDDPVEINQEESPQHCTWNF